MSIQFVARGAPNHKSRKYLSFARNLCNLLFSGNVSDKEFAKLVSTSEGIASRWVRGKQRR